MSIIKQLRFDYFVKKVRRTDDYDSVVDYVKSHKNLSDEELTILAYLICESNEACYLVEFAKIIGDKKLHCLNNIARTLATTDSPYFIDLFIKTFPKLKVNKILIDRLCELRSIKNLYYYFSSNEDYITSDNKRKIVSTIVNFGSIKEVAELARNYDILTQEERIDIIHRVCSSLEPYYICLVSFLFVNEDKELFVNSICKTKNAEMLYCFLEQNDNLNNVQIEKIVNSICETNDTEYIYRTLLVLDESNIKLRKMLMKKIKESEDLKYMMLMTVYADKDYLINKFDFVQSLYNKAVMTEDIFTDKELVDMCKYMQEVKSESMQLIKRKKNN